MKTFYNQIIAFSTWKKITAFTFFFLSFSTTQLKAQWDGQVQYTPKCTTCTPMNLDATLVTGSTASSNTADTVAVICDSTINMAYKIFDGGSQATGSFNLYYAKGNATSFTLYTTANAPATLTSLKLSTYSFLNPGRNGGQVRMYFKSISTSRYTNIVTIILLPKPVMKSITSSIAVDNICPKEIRLLRDSTPLVLSNSSALNYSYTWYSNHTNNATIYSVNSGNDSCYIYGVSGGGPFIYFKKRLDASYTYGGSSHSFTCYDSTYLPITIKTADTLSLTSGSKSNKATCVGVPFSTSDSLSIGFVSNGIYSKGTYSYQWMKYNLTTGTTTTWGSASSTKKNILPDYSTVGQFKYFCLATPANTSFCTDISDTSGVITILGTSTSTTSHSICRNLLPYIWNGTNYSSAGSYTAHFTNSAGCDSAATLVLTVKDTSTSTTSHSICRNLLPYIWNGHSYSSAGTYSVRLTNSNSVSCDSVATLILTVKDTSTSSSTITHCDSYTWNDSTYTNSGTYSFHTSNSVGCDSTAWLHLTINHSSITDFTVHLCYSSSFAFGFEDSLYTTTGIHYYPYTGVNGCDSIIRLHLFDDLLPSDTTYRTFEICAGETFHGLLFQVGSYTFWEDGTNQIGCDSITKKTLIVHPKTQSVKDSFVCSGQLPFTWHSNNVTTFGNYHFITPNQWGCDSTVTLRVKEIKADTTIRRDTICAGDSIVINGTSYKYQGTFYIKYTTLSNCDSFVEFHLKVNQPSNSTQTTYICNSCDYVWNGTTYSSAGSHTVHLTNTVGCDSAATLILHKGLINGPLVVCKGDTVTYTPIASSPLPAAYWWNLNSVTGSTGVVNITDSSITLTFNGADSAYIDVNALDSGFHTIYRDTVMVLVKNSPKPEIAAVIRVGCNGLGNELDSSHEANNHIPQVLPDSICINECEHTISTYYYANKKTGDTAYWKVTGGTVISSNSDSVKVLWGSAGSSTPAWVTLTAISSYGCMGTDEICVNIIESPRANWYAYKDSANLTKTIAICKHQAVQFIDSSTINSGSIKTWFINYGDGNREQFSTSMAVQHTYHTPGDYIAILKVENACHCYTTDTIRIHVIDTSGVVITCEGIVCEDATATYTASIVDSSSCSNLTQAWSAIGGTITGFSNGGKSVNIIWNHVDSTGYGYVLFDDTVCNIACPSKTWLKIPVIKKTGAKLSGPSSVCPNTPTLYKLPAWAGTQYDWAFLVYTLPAPAITLIHTNNPNEIIVNAYNQGGSSGHFSLYCKYYNDLAGCEGADTINIDIIANPSLTATATTICLGDTAHVNYYNPSGFSTDIYWTIATKDTILYDTTASSQLDFPIDKPGVYTFSVPSGSSCVAPSITIQVIDKPAKPDSITGPDTVCLNQLYKYEVMHPGDNANYVWQTTGSFQQDSTGNSVGITFTQGTQWQVAVIAKSNTGCGSDTTYKQVIITPKPICNLVNFSGYACPNTYTTIQASYTKATDYAWTIVPSITGSVVSGGNGSNPTILWNNEIGTLDSAIIKLKLRICDTTYDYQYTVSFKPKPDFTLSFDSAVCREPGVVTAVVTSSMLTSDISVLWNYGIGNTTTTTTHTNLNFSTATHSTPHQYPISATILHYKVGSCMTITDSIVATGPANYNKVTILPTPKLLVSYVRYDSTNCIERHSYIDSFVIGYDTTAGNLDSLVITDPHGSITSCIAPFACASQLASVHGIYYIRGFNNTTHCSSLIQVDATKSNCPVVCHFDSLPLPHVYINADSIQLCNTLHATGSFTTGGFNPVWYANGGIQRISPADSITYNGKVPVAGQHDVIYIVSFLDDSGQVCNITGSKTVTNPFVPRYTIQHSCITGDTIHYNTTITADTPTIGGMLPQYIFIVDGVATNNGSNPVLTQMLTQNANHSLQLKIIFTYNGQTDSCITDTYNFAVPRALIPAFTINRDKTCHEEVPVMFTNTSTGSYTNAWWEFDDGASTTIDNPGRVYTNPLQVNASYPYFPILHLTNPIGNCVEQYSLQVDVFNNKINGDLDAPVINYICPTGSHNLHYSNALTTPPMSPNYFYWLETHYHNPKNVPFDSGTSSTYTASQSGNYIVKYSDSVSGCYRLSPSSINIEKLNLAIPRITTEDGTITDTLVICEHVPFTLQVSPSYQDYNYWWYKDGDGSAYNSSSSVTLTEADGLNKDTIYHTYVVTVERNWPVYCIRTSRVFVVKVNPAPTAPVIKAPQVLNCDSYSIKLSINSPKTTGWYSWSNGTAGSSTTINEGGPYKVWYTDGTGCSSSAAIYVPLSAKNYLWMLPSGCYSRCIDDSLGIIIPFPPVYFVDWMWYIENRPFWGGHNSPVQPLHIYAPNVYGLMLNNGLCADYSHIASIDLSSQEGCGSEVNCGQVSVAGTNITYDGHCDSAYVTLILNNGGSINSHMTYTIFKNPNTYLTGGLLDTGNNTIHFTVYIGGGIPSIQLLLYPNGSNDTTGCLRTINLEINCDRGGRGVYTKTYSNILEIIPNPAKDIIRLHYVYANKKAARYTINIINFIGKIMSSYATDKQENLSIPIKEWARGLYIVQMLADGMIERAEKVVVE